MADGGRDAAPTVPAGARRVRGRADGHLSSPTGRPVSFMVFRSSDDDGKGTRRECAPIAVRILISLDGPMGIWITCGTPSRRL
jgi:hypothetical protein